MLFNVPSGNVSYNNAPGRTFNTSFQPNTTSPVRVSYTVTVNLALTLVVLGGSAFVYLEISADNATWTTINSAGNSKTLALGLSLNETTAFNVQGEVPLGYYCRLRGTVSGGGSIAFTSGQEVSY